MFPASHSPSAIEKPIVPIAKKQYLTRFAATRPGSSRSGVYRSLQAFKIQWRCVYILPRPHVVNGLKQSVF